MWSFLLFVSGSTHLSHTYFEYSQNGARSLSHLLRVSQQSRANCGRNGFRERNHGGIDGQTPVGEETEEDIQKRRQLLKDFGYKV
jgi:hypothetical protein